ncbi:MAG TPA: XdhC family protein [Solirubrobacteraceae bacterium]|nr:XdhC family protein [Solirubrobacteraceae bacterium]
MTLLERLAAIRERGGRAVLFTVVEGEGVGAKFLVEEGDTGVELAEEADEVIRGARNTLLELEGRKVFGEVYMPPPRLVVYGAVDTAEALCKAAKNLGWTTIVADARRAFATVERFPSADELIVEWPKEALARVAPDHQTAVIVLTHDAKFDQPALESALATEAFYIGALGSRRNQEKRRARLLEAGVPEEALERIAGPCGLDIGAESQEETAVSILGEILAVRAGRPGGFLRDAKRRIHAQEDAPAPSAAG